MGSFRDKSSDRPEELAILLGDMARRVVDASREELFTEVRSLTSQMRLVGERMTACSHSDADRSLCRRAIKDAADTLAQAGTMATTKLRADRLKDRNRPAYRRAQAARRFE